MGEPNPLLVRELRQALRVPRLPWTITAAVALIGLGMLSIGSLEAAKGRPAQLGVSLFQGFVSILLLYVALVGPATAAGAIALEREGKTLEPLLLTSLSPRDIARGKFLAAFGTLGVQVIALLPLAAIPLLFGGVTAVELVVCSAVVAALAAVSVAFGLAVASRTQTLRGALAVSILLPAAAAPLAFALVTIVGDSVARKRWPFLTGGPIWWSTAYTTVPFGLDYVVWLVVWPLLLLVLPFWLFTTLTAANLSGANDDRSSGIKRWFVGTALLVSAATFVTCFRLDIENAAAAALAGQVLTALLLMFMVVLLCAEPLAPSRLVRARWDRNGAGVLARMLGPGLMRGIAVQILLGMIMLAACYAGGVMASVPGGLRDKIGLASSGSARASTPGALAIVAAYTLMFDVFLLGVAAFLRTRQRGGDNAAVARAWTIALAVVAAIVPWIVATILSSLLHDERTAALFASPSPIFAIYAFNQELYRSGDPFHYTVAALSAALVWGALGLVFLGIAWERGRRSVQVAQKIAKQTEKKLDQEADEEWDEDDDEIDAVLHPAPPPPPPTAAGGPAATPGDIAANADDGDEDEAAPVPPPPPFPKKDEPPQGSS
jgi:ABC-type transport system involved in multi-copper enzyme maturation permease subunit